MSKVIQCPHFASDGLSRWCMNGRFPCDCESCDCKDKHYVEVYASTVTNTIANCCFCLDKNCPIRGTSAAATDCIYNKK